MFFLFGSNKPGQGGAEDFLYACDDLDSAMAHGEGIAGNYDGLSAWMHLAKFNGDTLDIVMDMVIPGTEFWPEEQWGSGLIWLDRSAS